MEIRVVSLPDEKVEKFDVIYHYKGEDHKNTTNSFKGAERILKSPLWDNGAVFEADTANVFLIRQ